MEVALGDKMTEDAKNVFFKVLILILVEVALGGMVTIVLLDRREKS